MQTPVETRYARSGEAHIAYQTVGSGSVDLILLPGAFSHVEHQWEEPSFARFLDRLASFSRLIVLDVRGTGLADRAAALPTWRSRSTTCWRCAMPSARSALRSSASPREAA